MLAYRARETTTTTGTGTLDLGGAVGTGFRAFADDIPTGRKVLYNIVSVDSDGDGDYEEGIGTLTHGTPDTLTRDTVLRSSNSDAKVNWGPGAKYVFGDIVPDYTPVDRTAESIAAAATINLGAAAGNFVHITGSTGPTTSLGTAPVAGKRVTTIFDSTPTFNHGASSIVLPGGANITFAAGDIATWRADTTTKWVCESITRAALPPFGADVLRGYIAGLTLSNNGSDPTNDIDTSAGIATDDGNAVVIKLASAITGRLDGGTWVVGANQPKLDTGSIANDVYHVWLIRRPDTGVVDVLFSASASSPTMPANYTQKRRIGAFFRVSGAILAFTQSGDTFHLSTHALLDVSATNPGTSAVTRALTVPDGIEVDAILNVVMADANQSGGVYLSPLSASDEAPSASAAPLVQLAYLNASSTLASWSGAIRTNTSAQIRTRVISSGVSTVLRIATLGWIDTRGRFS